MPDVFDKRLMKKLSYWISERESIRRAKDAGKPKPWTKDPILRDYRWCNVRRKDDRVSKWLAEVWYRQPFRHTAHGALVLATLGRMFNWPATLARLMPLEAWDRRAVEAIIKDHREKGNKVFTGAYIINGVGSSDKVKLVCGQVNAVALEAASILRPDSMRDTWQGLMSFKGIGSFIAGQIVADLRWFVPGAWGDCFNWAPVGPGSARGMRRLLGLPHIGPMPQKRFDDLLPHVWEVLMGYEEASTTFEELSCEAMDLQNCLCEFDKYCRLENNEGSVRSRYPGLPRLI